MTAPKFTPGPWEVHVCQNGEHTIMSGGYFVATLHDAPGAEADSLANAHLIAAAPELRERVEKMNALIDELMGNDELRPYLENIDGVWSRLCEEFDANGAALAKARGAR